MGDYTAADAASDLEWVERRIGEMRLEGCWVETIAKYEACAADLRSIIESETP